MILMLQLSAENLASQVVDMLHKNHTLGKWIWRNKVDLIKSDVLAGNLLWWIAPMRHLMIVEILKGQELFALLMTITQMQRNMCLITLLESQLIHQLPFA